MGKTAAENNVQQKPVATDANSVKAKDIRDYYASGAYSPAEVAEHFNVEEEDVMRVLKLNDEPNDEWNEPKAAPARTEGDEPTE